MLLQELVLKCEEGCFAYIPEMMEDVVPDLENKKTIIVTEKALKELFEDTHPDLQVVRSIYSVMR